MTRLVDLARATTTVCAPGTDPDTLAAVLAWSCGPRRSTDALRRRVRDAVHDVGSCARAVRDAGDVGEAGSAAPGASPAARVAAIARDDGGLDGPLADVALHVVRTWAGLGVRVALVGDAAYPVALAEGWPTTDAPVLIAWRGEPPASTGPGVAIVGARSASPYGVSVAELIASGVARAGGRVVSGGAVGIDAAAHAAALGLPGGTTVVLGCGHAVPYPAPHARPGGLFARVLDDGGTLLSELLPEVPPHAGVIRARNRVLAGLAVVTVVVEGGRRSGSLLTAGAAAERGREVLAVPGDVLAPGSVAPLRLLAEGARLCTGPDDVLALLPRSATQWTAPVVAGGGRTAPPNTPSDAPPHDGQPRGVLPAEVLRLLTRAGPRGIGIEELALAHGGGAGPLLAALTRARIAGVVEDVPGGVRLTATRPSDR